MPQLFAGLENIFTFETYGFRYCQISTTTCTNFRKLTAYLLMEVSIETSMIYCTAVAAEKLNLTVVCLFQG